LVFAVATDRPNPKIVKLLLDKGADREPALEWARRYQDPAILPLLGLTPAKPEDGAHAGSPRRTAREAIAKALAVSQPTAAKFVMTGGCVSCHADHLNGLAVSAAKWLEAAEPRTTEDRGMQLLGIAWAGHKAPSNRIQQLIAKQRPDGGWGQTDNLASDGYATGEALWALHETGTAASDPVYRRGVDFLLRAQQEDGTWHVATRALGFQPYFQSGFPYEHDQWISQAGTAMASIALSFAAK
jgi:Prenyltransferase and squalene oxidase repeat